MRSDGSPTIVAAAEVTATATSIDTGHGAPRLPTLIAVNAPTPRNAACASDSSPVRATSTSSPSAAIAVTATPTRIESLTSLRVSDPPTAAATATADGDARGRDVSWRLRHPAVLGVGPRAWR